MKILFCIHFSVMSDGGKKRSGEDPPDQGSKRPRGPADCLDWSDSDDECEFTPFTQENPVRIEPDVTSAKSSSAKSSSAKTSSAKTSSAKTSSAKKTSAKTSVGQLSFARKSSAASVSKSKSKGKCLGNVLSFVLVMLLLIIFQFDGNNVY